MGHWLVAFEGADGELSSWSGEAEESGHAVDLAKEAHGDDIHIVEVEQEEG